MLLNNDWVNSESKGKIKRYLEINENKNTITQNIRDRVEVVLTGKFIELKAYFKQQEKSQANNLLTLHIKELEKNSKHSSK